MQCTLTCKEIPRVCPAHFLKDFLNFALYFDYTIVSCLLVKTPQYLGKTRKSSTLFLIFNYCDFMYIHNGQVDWNIVNCKATLWQSQSMLKKLL